MGELDFTFWNLTMVTVVKKSSGHHFEGGTVRVWFHQCMELWWYTHATTSAIHFFPYYILLRRITIANLSSQLAANFGGCPNQFRLYPHHLPTWSVSVFLWKKKKAYQLVYVQNSIGVIWSVTMASLGKPPGYPFERGTSMVFCVPSSWNVNGILTVWTIMRGVVMHDYIFLIGWSRLWRTLIAQFWQLSHTSILADFGYVTTWGVSQSQCNLRNFSYNFPGQAIAWLEYWVYRALSGVKYLA